MKYHNIIAPFRNWSIAVKITTMFLSVVLGLFLISSIILGLKWNELLLQGLTARGQLMSEKAGAHIDRVIDRAETFGMFFDNRLPYFYNDTLSDAEILETVDILEEGAENFLSGNSLVSGIAFASEGNGESAPTHSLLYCHTQNGMVILNQFTSGYYARQDWFLKARESKDPFWTGMTQINSQTPEACLYVTPVRNPNTGNFVGALVVEVKKEILQKEINEIPIEGESLCFLYQDDGQHIVNSDNVDPRKLELIKQDIREAERRYEAEPPSSTGYVHLTEKSNAGRSSNIFLSPCKNGWNISLVMAGDWVESRLWDLSRYVAGIFLLTFPIIFLSSYILTRKITAPLTRLSHAAEAIGSGHFNVSLPKYNGRDEIGQLTTSFEQMQHELSIYLQELKKSFQQQETMESQINIARTIQEGILPKIESTFINPQQFDLDATLIPAKGVGGDLYDFFYLDDNHLALIIGDVSGKGIPAALFMSVTQTLHRGIAFRFKDPSAIVTQLNKLLMSNNEASMFVTYFIGIINTESGRMDYCNAGHNLPMIRRSNGNLEVLTTQHGLPLGIFEENYSCNDVVINPGDTLILYTDGITEAFNPHNELFGEARLKEAISYALSGDPHKITKTILSHLEIFVEGFEQSDDITLLALQMKNTWQDTFDQPSS